MLGKLFRHEWKDCWGIVGIMNLIVLAFSFVGSLLFHDNLWEMADSNEYAATAIALYVVLYFSAIMALSFCTGFFFYLRFYKNLYTDEGYLLHTLPVSSHQLIWSKTFVAIIWQVIGILVTTFSILNFINCVYKISEGESIWHPVMEIIIELFQQIEAYMIPFFIMLITFCMVAPFFSLFLGYASISLGQRAKKHKILAAIGFYFGITTALQIVSSFTGVFAEEFLFELNLNFSNPADIYMFLALIFAILTLVYGGLAAIFYFLTHYIMKNQLNLE